MVPYISVRPHAIEFLFRIPLYYFWTAPPKKTSDFLKTSDFRAEGAIFCLMNFYTSVVDCKRIYPLTGNNSRLAGSLGFENFDFGVKLDASR